MAFQQPQLHRRQRRGSRAAILDTLESRILLNGDAILSAFHHDHDEHGLHALQLPGGAGAEPPLPPVDLNPLTALPLLQSLPGAAATLFLDFDGVGAVPNWGTSGAPATPAYSTDGDTTTYSAGDLANIQEIFTRVAEKFSPLNINVTTIDPGAYTPFSALRVVIGGNSEWTGGDIGGLAYVSSFTGGIGRNTIYIFSDNLFNGTPRYVADAVAHESGHAFGLRHQASYDANGTLLSEYNNGDAGRSPIMGIPYNAVRSLWWVGPNIISSGSIQDDLEVLAGGTNGFGYRPDGHADALQTALSVNNNRASFSANGVIERVNDVDVIAFTTHGGTASFSVLPAAVGAMLDASLVIFDAQGNRVAESITSSLNESLQVTLGSGTYYVAVASAGNIGDVGQWSLTATLPDAPPPPPPPPDQEPPPDDTGGGSNPTVPVLTPSALEARLTTQRRVLLTWSLPSSPAVTQRLEIATNGAGFSTLAQLAATDLAYQTTALPVGTHVIRLTASDSSGNTVTSNEVNIRIAAPTGRRMAANTPVGRPLDNGSGRGRSVAAAAIEMPNVPTLTYQASAVPALSTWQFTLARSLDTLTRVEWSTFVDDQQKRLSDLP